MVGLLIASLCHGFVSFMAMPGPCNTQFLFILMDVLIQTPRQTGHVAIDMSLC